MNNNKPSNPAEIAAAKSLKAVLKCIKDNKSFILEAGAGSGKTYNLIETLQFLVESQSKELLRKNRRIACITYTNVAKEEIISRIDKNPVVLADTIHSFCWSLIKDFQPYLRKELPTIGKWNVRITKEMPMNNKPIQYQLGYPKITEKNILLGHDDVLILASKMMSNQKFQNILKMKFPIILIDEYQDTDKQLTDSLIENFINKDSGLLVGFFGDHWQKIYVNGCGKIESPNLISIDKRANFRSDKKIVESLNRMRKELTQEVSNPNSIGSIDIYHTNCWKGERRSEPHWKGDLPSQIAHQKLNKVRSLLESKGWDFNPKKTKILMLTHNILAEEQGYKNLASVFPRKESYIKKEDKLISFLTDTIEPICLAYKNKQYSQIFSVIRSRAFIKNQADKVTWSQNMERLLKLRETGTIGDIVDYIIKMDVPELPESTTSKLNKIELLDDDDAELNTDEIKKLKQLKKLLQINYTEVIALTKFINDKTPFSTEHGVKGAEFENVLVVFGRGWNHYNFAQMLEWAQSGVPNKKEKTFERNRNLFYVVCSRPKKRLSLFFTQELNDKAMETLTTWFECEPTCVNE
jgi:DNA helicase-2/ATP-dependent DNA helicase PcrA